MMDAVWHGHSENTTTLLLVNSTVFVPVQIKLNLYLSEQ